MAFPPVSISLGRNKFVDDLARMVLQPQIKTWQKDGKWFGQVISEDNEVSSQVIECNSQLEVVGWLAMTQQSLLKINVWEDTSEEERSS